MKTIVDLAWEIIEMDRIIREQAREINRLHKVDEQLKTMMSESIRHGEKMLGGILQLALTPGVSEAIAKAREEA